MPGVPALAARDQRPRVARRGPGRAAGRTWRRSSEWGVGQRLLEGCSPAPSSRNAFEAELARGSLPPAKLAGPVLDKVTPIVERDRRRGTAARRHGPRGLRSTSTSACRTAGRSRAPSPAFTATRSAASATRACGRGTGSERGCGCSRLSAARPERPYRVGGHRPCSAGRVDGAQTTVARIAAAGGAEDGAALAARDPRRPLRPRHARAAAARLRRVGRVRASRPAAARTPAPPRSQQWETAFRLRQGGSRARAPARLRAARCRSPS